MINREKSGTLFSANTPSQVKHEVMHVLGLQTEMNGGKYPGLPVYVGRSRARCFEYLKERIWKRIQGWMEKLLSMAGKEILIKAVAQAIPTCAMGCFDLTQGLCDDISKIIRRYWWSQQKDENRLPLGWLGKDDSSKERR